MKTAVHKSLCVYLLSALQSFATSQVNFHTDCFIIIILLDFLGGYWLYNPIILKFVFLMEVFAQ